ncbi:MAG: hypothetical protein JWP35_299 [Caulobacter sp.]|nr:hypothetical protein [Caulobacter sp.]
MRRALFSSACLRLTTAGIVAAAVSAWPVVASPARQHSHTYLLSVVIPLKTGQYVSDFKFETWGVDVIAVCHFPPGWRIRAGRAATSDGVLEGEASQGITFLSGKRMRELRGLFLVRPYGGIQRKDIGSVPATFAGTATIGGYGPHDDDRKINLDYRNLHLTPANHCPAP